jgi:hypothetical protein
MTSVVNVLEAVIRQNNQGTNTDVYIERISREDWLNVPDKTTQARPAQFYVERTTIPKVYFYPAPAAGYTFVYYRIRRIQDAGGYTNTADVNFRFLPCLASGLAYYLSLKFAADRTAGLEGDLRRRLPARCIGRPRHCQRAVRAGHGGMTWPLQQASIPTDCATTVGSGTSTTYCARTGAGSWCALMITSPRSRSWSRLRYRGDAIALRDPRPDRIEPVSVFVGAPGFHRFSKLRQRARRHQHAAVCAGPGAHRAGRCWISDCEHLMTYDELVTNIRNYTEVNSNVFHRVR